MLLPVLRQLLVCWGFWGPAELLGGGGLLVASEPFFGLLEPIWAYLGDETHSFVLHQKMLALLGLFEPYLGLCRW